VSEPTDALRKAIEAECDKRGMPQDSRAAILARAERGVGLPGLSVAVLGPDGSGKSSLIAHCSESLSELFSGVDRHHLRPGLLPALGVLIDPRSWFKPRPTVVTVDPHAGTPSGAAISLLRLGYYSADYILGFGVIVTRAVRAGRLVLFDRYHADLEVDPRRWRIALPDAVRSAVAERLPELDLSVLLQGDPKQLRARKPELDVAELERQLAAYQHVASRYAHTTTVCVDGELATSQHDFNRAILEARAAQLIDL
jgi:thymidylate kinase